MTGPGDEPGATPAELRSAVTAAAARIHEIIDAAERAAGEIRRDAEAEAALYLAERKREADRQAQSVSIRVARIREEAQALADELDRTDEPPVSPVQPQVPTAARPVPIDSRRTSAEEVRVRALMRATQMAVTGESREAIDRSLREEFGFEDTGPILDEILGRRPGA